jgi:flavin reductase (DIM6/NTAB) family NADH-FMN oxidoreductase RutF
MASEQSQGIVHLDTEAPIWSRFFTIAPLVVVGTLEHDGMFDLAPKHMAMPLGWQNYFCFVCSPRHATQRNAQSTGQFTVSFPKPEQLVPASLTASARADDGSKPAIAALATMPAHVVSGVLVRDAYLWLECTLERVVDGFGENSLIVGEIIAASIDEQALRASEADDAELISQLPLLAYISPGRFATVSDSFSFPFPADFRL